VHEFPCNFTQLISGTNVKKYEVNEFINTNGQCAYHLMLRYVITGTRTNDNKRKIQEFVQYHYKTNI